MEARKTVILGEASEESDSEDVVLSDGEPSQYKDSRDLPAETQSAPLEQTSSEPSHRGSGNVRNRGGLFGANSIFASIGSPGNALAKLVNYAPHDLLASASSSQRQRPRPATEHKPAQGSIDDNNTNDPYNQMALFHRSLFAKNRQLQASLTHLYKHPLQAASKGLHTINQRLVSDQKLIQEVLGALIKIKREEKHLDVEINLIAQ